MVSGRKRNRYAAWLGVCRAILRGMAGLEGRAYGSLAIIIVPTRLNSNKYILRTLIPIINYFTYIGHNFRIRICFNNLTWKCYTSHICDFRRKSTRHFTNEWVLYKQLDFCQKMRSNSSGPIIQSPLKLSPTRSSAMCHQWYMKAWPSNSMGPIFSYVSRIAYMRRASFCSSIQ